MGKTVWQQILLIMQQKISKLKLKSPVAFFFRNVEQLSTGILSEQSRIKSNDIRRGKATEEELGKIY